MAAMILTLRGPGRTGLTPARGSCHYCAMADPEIERVLEFWFSDAEQNALKIDSRMERWFGSDPVFDDRVREEFGDLVGRASSGELMDWTETPAGRLALIIVLDQFRRNIFRGTGGAYARDQLALKICIEGTVREDYRRLAPMQRLFFFMPLQHAESLKIQEKSVQIYTAMADKASGTLKETFLTAARFAELHRDIVAEFGRFPHRNAALGRENTPAEAGYLAGDAQTFGQ